MRQPDLGQQFLFHVPWRRRTRKWLTGPYIQPGSLGLPGPSSGWAVRRSALLHYPQRCRLDGDVIALVRCRERSLASCQPHTHSSEIRPGAVQVIHAPTEPHPQCCLPIGR
jgi:hypothetical protein